MPEFPIDEAALAAYREQVEKTFSTVFPRGFQAKFGEFTAETKDRWFRERWLCLKYHLYLSGHARVDKPDAPQLPPEYTPIMGMDFQENPHSLLFKEFIQKRPGDVHPRNEFVRLRDDPDRGGLGSLLRQSRAEAGGMDGSARKAAAGSLIELLQKKGPANSRSFF